MGSGPVCAPEQTYDVEDQSLRARKQARGRFVKSLWRFAISRRGRRNRARLLTS
jgi:hypothetical protein